MNYLLKHTSIKEIVGAVIGMIILLLLTAPIIMAGYHLLEEETVLEMSDNQINYE